MVSLTGKTEGKHCCDSVCPALFCYCVACQPSGRLSTRQDANRPTQANTSTAIQAAHPHLLESCCCKCDKQLQSQSLLQFMVDISTPASVLDGVSRSMRAHMDANATEYKPGSATVSFNSNGDPLKVQLVAGFDFSHNGAPSCTHEATSTTMSQASFWYLEWLATYGISRICYTCQSTYCLGGGAYGNTSLGAVLLQS